MTKQLEHLLHLQLGMHSRKQSGLKLFMMLIKQQTREAGAQQRLCYTARNLATLDVSTLFNCSSTFLQ
jgi:hypothetical protein